MQRSREEDEFILDVLAMRRTKTPGVVAKKFSITKDRVKQICDEIKKADLLASTRKNVEKITDVVLQYPQR